MATNFSFHMDLFTLLVVFICVSSGFGSSGKFGSGSNFEPKLVQRVSPSFSIVGNVLGLGGFLSNLFRRDRC